MHKESDFDDVIKADINAAFERNGWEYVAQMREEIVSKKLNGSEYGVPRAKNDGPLDRSNVSDGSCLCFHALLSKLTGKPLYIVMGYDSAERANDSELDELERYLFPIDQRHDLHTDRVLALDAYLKTIEQRPENVA